MNEITPIERSCIFRKADEIGYIPGIGSVVGVCRIISGIALNILIHLGAIFYAGIKGIFARKPLSEKEVKSLSYLVVRANDEMARGFVELIPFLAQYMDKRGLRDERCGLLNLERMAQGKCLYFSKKNEIYYRYFPYGVTQCTYGELFKEALDPIFHPV